MGIITKGKSTLLKIILLSCAGLSLAVALSVVIFTNSNTNETKNYFSRSAGVSDSGANRNEDLLKLSINGLISNSDLTILGHLSLTNELETVTVTQQQQQTETENQDNPIVRIARQGRVRGTVLKSRENRDYFAFYQVPYAQPPVRNLRFALPKEPRSWRGIRDGTKIGPECLQSEKYATEPNITAGTEDCLHLNIYTPKLPKSLGWGRKEEPNLPVLFYIHGGGPHGNGTRYGAKYFMDEDAVLITVEFRLGAFGGFTKGTKEFPGNLGCRDQVQALRWIQKNIHRFGGDPKKVLIFGNSSGASFVHAHVISPMSKGLFHGAIMQSGNCFQPAELLSNPVEKSQEFANEVGCSNSNETSREILKCLRSLDGRAIALSKGQPALTGITIEEHEDDWQNKFLAERPWDLVTEGKVGSKNVPVIIGVNSKEFFHIDSINEMLLNENSTKFLNENFEEEIPKFTTLPKGAEVAKKFRQVYFGSKNISAETRFQMWDLFSDFTVHSSRVSGMTLSNVTGQPVYFYWLAKEPAKSYGEKTKALFPPPYGVAHADELQYLFLYDGYPEYSVESSWFEFSKKLVKTWVSFAREGKPNIENLPGNKENIQWEPISLEDNGMTWLQLDDEIKYVQPFTKRMKLWDEYIDVLYG